MSIDVQYTVYYCRYINVYLLYMYLMEIEKYIRVETNWSKSFRLIVLYQKVL